MDANESLKFKKRYAELEDFKIMELLEEGEAGLVPGAYALLREEVERRGLNNGNFLVSQKSAHAVPGVCSQCGKENVKLAIYWNEIWCNRCRGGFGNKRMGAYILDLAFMYLCVLVLTFSLGVIFSESVTEQSPVVSGTIGLVLLLFFLKDGIQGRSIGKRALGLQVIDRKSMRPAHLMQSFMRNLPFLIPFVALFSATTLEQESRLGEGWAGTGVVPYRVNENGQK